MSNIGSTSGQHGDNAALPQFSRKRSSPNSGSLKSETSSATSVAAVGSSSSKLRRITHSSVEQNPEGNDLSRQQTSHLLGALETGSVSGGSGRSGPSRSGHDSVRSELKYLTDFFPDQNPSDRRLTRSQRQYSIPVSTSQTADSIDNSAHTNSGSVVVEQSRYYNFLLFYSYYYFITFSYSFSLSSSHPLCSFIAEKFHLQKLSFGFKEQLM
ncbi:unnamed protein product [Brugia timori]|uniref:SUN domain-containing protein n=1 Tax=Brugia timori TaxID=42155 RepID=A0A0R3QR86_9BILA|nr:unnamed protein product [Brugia timori]